MFRTKAVMRMYSRIAFVDCVRIYICKLYPDLYFSTVFHVKNDCTHNVRRYCTGHIDGGKATKLISRPSGNNGLCLHYDLTAVDRQNQQCH